MKTKQPKKYEVKEHQEGYASPKGQDLQELAASILKLIGEDKQKRATLVGLLVSDVATKQEFTTILAELKAMRETSDKRFEASERRFEVIESELKAMREASDKRFEVIESQLKTMQEISGKRFEASDKRFEAIDKRFGELIGEMNKRFEQQREDFHLAIKTSTEALNKSLTDKISKLGSRWGFMAEDTFSKALAEILGKAGFQVSKWRKTDTEAEVFMRPRDVEIDILVKNGKRIAIEIKSAISVGDIEMFAKVVRFYEKSESVNVDDKIMVGIHLHREVDKYAKELGIKIISQIEDVVDED